MVLIVWCIFHCMNSLRNSRILWIHDIDTREQIADNLGHLAAFIIWYIWQSECIDGQFSVVATRWTIRQVQPACVSLPIPNTLLSVLHMSPSHKRISTLNQANFAVCTNKTSNIRVLAGYSQTVIFNQQKSSTRTCSESTQYVSCMSPLYVRSWALR